MPHVLGPSLSRRQHPNSIQVIELSCAMRRRRSTVNSPRTAGALCLFCGLRDSCTLVIRLPVEETTSIYSHSCRLLPCLRCLLSMRFRDWRVGLLQNIGTGREEVYGMRLCDMLRSGAPKAASPYLRWSIARSAGSVPTGDPLLRVEQGGMPRRTRVGPVAVATGRMPCDFRPSNSGERVPKIRRRRLQTQLFRRFQCPLPSTARRTPSP